MSKSLGSNLIFNILKNIANIIFPLITAPYVARVLNPDSLGLANFASTYAGYFMLVAALGIPNYGIREVSKRRGSKKELSMVFSELFSISILTTVFTSLVFLLTLFLIGQLKHDFIIFLIAGITLFTTPFNIDWFYSGLEDFQYLTIRSLAVKTISVICLFLFVRDEADLIIFVLLNALSGCVNQVWNVLVLLKSGIRIRLGLSGIRNHVKPLLLLFSSTIAISLYTTVNVLMLGFASTYDQVSYYNQANHLSRAFLAVVTSLSEIMVPRLSFLRASGDWDNINKLVNKSFSLVSFLAVPIAIGIICISPVFIPLFLGEKFIGTVLPLQIMSIIVFVIGLNNISTIQILMGLGYDSKLLKTVMLGAICNVVINLFFIPLWGASGAAVASVLAELVILVVSVYYVLKNTDIRINTISDMLKSLLGGVLFIPLTIMLKSIFTGWTLVFLLALSYFILYILTQWVMRSASFGLIVHFISKRTVEK